MRRASSPAICTTPSRAPPAVSSSSALRSLSSLALSRSADRKRARPVLDGEHPPVDRDPLHVHVQHREEDADPRSGGRRQVQLGRRQHLGRPWRRCRRPRRAPRRPRRRHPARVAEEGRGGRGGERPEHGAAPGQRPAQTPAATATPATIGRPPGCIGGTAARTSPATCGSENRTERRAGTTHRAGRLGTSGLGRLLGAATRMGRACGGYGTPGRRRSARAGHRSAIRIVAGRRRPGTQRAGAVIPRDDDPGRGTARPLPSDGRWALCGTARYVGAVGQVSPSIRSIVQITSRGSP